MKRVQIVRDADGEVVWHSEPIHEHKADRMVAGAQRNLDHSRFTVRVVDEPVEAVGDDA